MILSIDKAELPSVRILTPGIFEDHRGQYINLWNANAGQKDVALAVQWKEDDLSVSKHGVIRGFHGDDSTYKLISCLYGSIFVVVVCADKRSRHYLKWSSFFIDEVNRKQIFIPPKHGLAHQVLSETALFWYKQSSLYLGAENQFTLNPFDPKLSIPWPITDYVVSERDHNAPFV